MSGGLQSTMIRPTTTIPFSPELPLIQAYKSVTMQMDSTKVDCTIGVENSRGCNDAQWRLKYIY